MEKENKLVRFHAKQAIVTFLPLFIFGFSIRFFPNELLRMILDSIYSISYIGLGLFLMYTAYKGQEFKLPYVGDLTEKIFKK